MCLLWEGTNKRKTKGAIDFCVTVKEEKKKPKVLFTVPQGGLSHCVSITGAFSREKETGMYKVLPSDSC